MVTLKSSDHTYLLVNFYADLKMHFKIVLSSSIVSCNYSSLDENIFIKFPDMIRHCKVIDTSNNRFDLEYQIPSLLSKCGLIAADDGGGEEDVKPYVNLPIVNENDSVVEDGIVNEGYVEPDGCPVTIEEEVVEKEKSFVKSKVNHPVTVEKNRVDEEVSVKKKQHVVKKKSVDESSTEHEVNHPVTAMNDPLDKEGPVKKKKSVQRTVQRPQREAAKRKINEFDDDSDDVDYLKNNDNSHINDGDVVRENGLVRFGKYETSITEEAFKTIDWSSYVIATRQLLRIIFTKDILATHSLTGNRCSINVKLMTEPRPQLDFRKVEDLISIVSKKCGVKEVFAIRLIIRNKCSDELRESRRLKYKKSQVSNNRATVIEERYVEEDHVDDEETVDKKKSVDEKDVEHEVHLPVTVEKDRVGEEVFAKKKQHVVKKKSVDESSTEHEVNHPVTAMKDPLDKEGPVKRKTSVVKVNLPVKVSERIAQRPQREAAKRKRYEFDELFSDDDDYVKNNDNNHINDGDLIWENGLVRFGKYETPISADAFKTIDWSCYVVATRQLLRIIFTKDILATHSLTGRRTSINDKLMREPRPQLDFRKVEDLISIVSKKCDVKDEFAIRRIIRNKCSVELKQARKFKCRQSYKQYLNV